MRPRGIQVNMQNGTEVYRIVEDRQKVLVSHYMWHHYRSVLCVGNTKYELLVPEHYTKNLLPDDLLLHEECLKAAYYHVIPSEANNSDVIPDSIQTEIRMFYKGQTLFNERWVEGLPSWTSQKTNASENVILRVTHDLQEAGSYLYRFPLLTNNRSAFWLTKCGVKAITPTHLKPGSSDICTSVRTLLFRKYFYWNGKLQDNLGETIIAMLVNAALVPSLPALAEIAVAEFNNTSLPMKVLIGLLLGLSLYFVRSRYRLTYGVSEVIVGLWMITQNVGNVKDLTTVTSSWLPLLGGVYVIVRGFDNIGKFAMSTDRLGGLWRWVFGERC